MNNPIKTIFFIGVGIVGGCAILVNNRTKIKLLIKSVIEAWDKTKEFEEASIVSVSPINEMKSTVEITA
jgi:hypothetical protein